MSLFRTDDKIFGTQKCYRTMLSALCTPGSPRKMDIAGNERGLISGVPSHVALISLTLLDEQVSVAAFGTGYGSWLEEIISATGAREASVSEADYIIASSVPKLKDLRSVKQGTLLSPEQGATLIIRLDEKIEGKAGTLEIRGPGIEDVTLLKAGPAVFSLMKHRSALEFEYPLGFDLFLVDSKGNLLGLPRTSSVKTISKKG